MLIDMMEKVTCAYSCEEERGTRQLLFDLFERQTNKELKNSYVRSKVAFFNQPACKPIMDATLKLFHVSY